MCLRAIKTKHYSCIHFRTFMWTQLDAVMHACRVLNVLSIERERAEVVNFHDVIKDFATRKARKVRVWMTTYWLLWQLPKFSNPIVWIFSVYWLLMWFNGCGLVVDSWRSWIHVSAIPHSSVGVFKSRCDRLIGLLEVLKDNCLMQLSFK